MLRHVNAVPTPRQKSNLAREWICLGREGAPRPAVRHSHAEPQRTNLSKRELLATTVATLTAGSACWDQNRAEALPFGLFEAKGPKLPPNVVLDRTLAYTFTYPTKTASGREVPIVASRKPEKYSSAAPLVADARQRIVAEYVSLADGITCSMFVGPVTGPLARQDPSEWSAASVANVVLSDRSANRNYAGQKLPIANLESSSTVERDGVKYYVYETLQTGSPTLFDPSKNTLRVGLSITAARPGLEEGSQYLYTLSLACPSGLWEDLEGGFRSTIDSFALLPPTSSYVPPDKDPWNIF